jgi:hypothetical protein
MERLKQARLNGEADTRTTEGQPRRVTIRSLERDDDYDIFWMMLDNEWEDDLDDLE